jgi:hypothetical protein
LNNLGTQNDPILEDLGITSVLANPGISITGNTVTNTGVIYINSGAGIVATGNSDITLSHTGVSSITASNPSITVGAGSSPLISNTGLLSVIASTGITNTSTAQTPDLSNAGVIDISGDGSILITDFPNIKLSTTHPSISLIGTLVNAVMTPSTTSSGTTPIPGRIPITQIPGSVWATSIATQLPYSTGTFIIHLSLGTFIKASSTFPNNFGQTNITIFDSIHNVSYPVPDSINDFNRLQSSSRFFPTSGRTTIMFPLMRIVIDLATLWATGFREMTDIQITQLAGSGSGNSLSLTAQNTNVFATYSPSVIFA